MRNHMLVTSLCFAWCFVTEAQIHMHEGLSLMGGTSTQGFALITYNGRSGLLCADGVGREEGKVLCRDLGLPYQHPSVFGHQGPAGTVFLGSHVRCRGDEIKVSDCQHQRWGTTTSCNSGQAVFVSCQADPCTPSPCMHGGQCVLTSSGLGYQCHCTSGWTGQHCTSDVNECGTNNGGCSDVCVNEEGSYTCGCSQSYLHLGPDNHTCTVPGEHVTCGSDVMELTFEKAAFPSLHGEHMTLLDVSCGATENATHIILRAPLSACGTVSQQQGSSIVYQNLARSVEEVVEGVISRVKEVRVPFQCTMNLNLVHELPVHVDSQELHFLLEGTGRHDVSLQFSTDGKFQPGQGQGQVSVYPGQELYGRVTLSTLDPNVGVVLSNCSATTNMTLSSADTPYDVLENGCPVDSSLLMENRTQLSEHQDFHLQAFKFLNNHHQVAFHCDVTLCDPADVGSFCDLGCVQSASG
ncbi:CUB and zona pellucida-like domain-containing protein 1 [Babylonia areolata]|uniref:CUB and zona pellucida-like domain-containing protein 1 n=1 Tax=Babylonia areolata TaxID=304850 RepID=UPI003FD0C040